MQILKQSDNIRVIADKKLSKDNMDLQFVHNLVSIQICINLFIFSYWHNIKTLVYIGDDKDEINFIKREAIELYNNIIYPYKYFITNGKV